MDILVLFLNFVNDIFSFKILGIDLFTLLITITINTLIFSMLKNIGNSKGKDKKQDVKNDDIYFRYFTLFKLNYDIRIYIYL